MVSSSHEDRSAFRFINYFPGRGTLLEQIYLVGKSVGYAKVRMPGQASPFVEGILRVLEVRRLDVSSDVRDRVTACTDLDRLTVWLRRALTVAKAEELFTESERAPEEPPGS